MNVGRPIFVQRCRLTAECLEYDYMGNVYFEGGAQGRSLRRIFSRGIETTELTVHVSGKNITVHMVAGKGFNFAMYQQWLQQMAEGNLRLEESPRLNDAIRMLLKMETFTRTNINAWFDFTNDILWTIDEKNHRNLVERLGLIEQAWAASKVQK